jgi:hypothetical protein
VLFQCIRFCERLRAARGLPFRSKFSSDHFDLTARWSAAESRLAQTITLNYLQPTGLTEILDRLSQDSGFEIIVDWIAVSELGWTPDAETTMQANQQPFRETLTGLLRPMDLAYRIIDKQMIQVTTPAALDAEWDIEFYPAQDALAEGESGEKFIERQRERLGRDRLDQVGGAFHWDEPSGHLIAALPQPDQRELGRLLLPDQSP